jgi:hypothetical protein
MKNDEKLWEISKDILQEMYMKAKPPLDFRKALADGRLNKKEWFMNHELSMKEQEAIIEKHVKANKVTPRERRRMAWPIFDYSPKMAKEDLL